ncbi:MAG: hypothetical protein ACJAZO_002810 [Myxococcota bacterium]|jgi:hypothetical protein
MHVVEHADPLALTVRSHPWFGSTSDRSLRHHDLRERPELIRSALEDFTGWTRYPAIETFYQCMEWLNGPASTLETNDCAFTGPATNEMPQFAKALQCSGRVMLLFRDLPHNLDEQRVHVMTQEVARGLASRDNEFQWGVVGATIVPVRFIALPGNDREQLGSQLMLSFWAWGDDEYETLMNLDRTLTNLFAVLRDVSA